MTKRKGGKFIVKKIIERKVDSLGRIIIPVDFRNKLGIISEDTLEIKVEDNKLVLTKKERS